MQYKKINKPINMINLAIVVVIAVLFIKSLYNKAKTEPISKPYETMTFQEVELAFDIELLIPTFKEVQTMLASRGYEVKIDGIIGQDTLKTWDRAICDRHAVNHIEKID